MQPRDVLEGSRSPTPDPIWDDEEEEDTGEEEEEEEEETSPMLGRKGSDDDETSQEIKRNRKRSISPAADSARAQKRARALDDGEDEKISEEPVFSSISQKLMVCT